MYMRHTLCGWLALAVMGFGCGQARPTPPGGGGRGETDGGLGAEGGAICDSRDTDRDGIADVVESSDDRDLDGAPNSRDADADEDGIPDAEEHGSDDPCLAVDTDTDGTPDFLDLDSDNDGLPDAEERRIGSDPREADSDGDGVTDLGEHAAGTDPLDPTSTIPEDDFFVVLPYEGDAQVRPLRFGTDIEVADVFFLVDMTGSMGSERTNLIQGLVDTIVPGIQAEVDNAWFGVGGFDDYPENGYGGGNDLPFYLLLQMSPPDEDLGAWSIPASARDCPRNPLTRDIGEITGAPNSRPDILDAVEGLPCHGGSDGPESYVPALWATATGMGLSWPSGRVPDQECTPRLDMPGVPRGYPCFRAGALPIVLLFGDNSFHNGPMGEDPYAGFSTPSYAAAVTALRDIGARVIGVWSGGSFSRDGRAHFEAVARDTGAVRADGTPLVFDIGSDGGGLSSAIVDAVATLVSDVPQDVSTRLENGAGNPDAFDATQFIQSVVPVEGYTPDGTPGGYERKDATSFYEVIPGTQVEFRVTFQNLVRAPRETAEVFRARIVVVGNGVADLDARNVYIIVPPEGGIVFI